MICVVTRDSLRNTMAVEMRSSAQTVQILEPGRPNPPTVGLTNYARLLHYRQKQ
jgi:hypothetical protein